MARSGTHRATCSRLAGAAPTKTTLLRSQRLSTLSLRCLFYARRSPIIFCTRLLSPLLLTLSHIFFFALRRKQLFVLLIEGSLRKNAANVNASRRNANSVTGRIVGKGSPRVEKTARVAQKSRLLQKKSPTFSQKSPSFFLHNPPVINTIIMDFIFLLPHARFAITNAIFKAS